MEHTTINDKNDKVNTRPNYVKIQIECYLMPTVVIFFILLQLIISSGIARTFRCTVTTSGRKRERWDKVIQLFLWLHQQVLSHPDRNITASTGRHKPPLYFSIQNWERIALFVRELAEYLQPSRPCSSWVSASLLAHLSICGCKDSATAFYGCQRNPPMHRETLGWDTSE